MRARVDSASILLGVSGVSVHSALYCTEMAGLVLVGSFLLLCFLLAAL